MSEATLDEEAANRVRRALSRPGVFIMEARHGYDLRSGHDPRRKPILAFDEQIFRALVVEPGLRARPEGGWMGAQSWVEAAAPIVSTMGVTIGAKVVVEMGAAVVLRANLTPSALEWLASRRDAQGGAWLSPAQLAAAERLQEDRRLAGTIGRLTMDWSGSPRQCAAGGGLSPAERSTGASMRMRRALAALDQRTRPVVESLCFRGLSLRDAEAGLGLAGRSARAVLQAGLNQLVKHYGILP